MIVSAPAARAASLSSNTTVTARRGYSQNLVDGTKSTHMTAKSVEVGVGQTFTWGGLAVTAEQLTRHITDQASLTASEKSTSVISPAFTANVRPGFSVGAGFEVFRTDVASDLVQESEYDLNAQRGILRGTWVYGKGDPGEGDSVSLSLASEARAERHYQVSGSTEDLVDRDYIPAQVELTYDRRASDRLRLTATTRYSHFNKDVYEDRYDSELAQATTTSQAFDYLLSFRAAARLALSRSFAVVGELGRKGILDTDSYTGDEHLVGTGGSIGVEAEVGPVQGSLKYLLSTGSKDHRIAGERYSQASRQSAALASLVVAL